MWLTTNMLIGSAVAQTPAIFSIFANGGIVKRDGNFTNLRDEMAILSEKAKVGLVNPHERQID